MARPVVSVFLGLSPSAARVALAATLAAALTRAHLPPIALSIGRASRFASTLVHFTLSPHLWMRDARHELVVIAYFLCLLIVH